MARHALILGLAGAAAALIAAPAPALAPAPRIEFMVVGKSRVLRTPVTVRAPAVTVAVGRRRCAIGAGTPLAVLEAARRGARGPGYRLQDYGACSSRPADAASLYVTRVGNDVRGGPNGWVYKLGRRTPGLGAADLGARVRTGGRLTWFYCRTQRSGGCQRTLEIGPAPGPPPASLLPLLRVLVRGYDDNGRGIPVAGVTVRAGGAEGRTGADGVAFVTPQPGAGRYRVTAEKAGLVPAFPVMVSTG